MTNTMYITYAKLFDAEFEVKKLTWLQRRFRTQKAVDAANNLYYYITCVSQLIEHAVFGCDGEKKSWIFHLHRVEQTYHDLVGWHNKMPKIKPKEHYERA